MIGKTHMIWLALTVVSSGALFHTSYRVQELNETLGRINREIIREQEAIQVLKAEWAYLNEPARLERLVREYTALAPTEAVQLAASVEEIPMRDPAVDGPALVAATPLPGRKPGYPLAASGETRVAEAPPTEPSYHAVPASGQVASIPSYGPLVLTSYGNAR